MTTPPATAHSLSHYLAEFESLQQESAARDPSWLQNLRSEAFLHFTQSGFPTARRGNEDWKYTDIGPLAKTAFETFASSKTPSLGFQSVQPFTYGGASGNSIVFVNGAFSKALSSPALGHAADLTLLPLNQAIAQEEKIVQDHLGWLGNIQNQAFLALNTAFLHDGAIVFVPENTVLEEPILVLHLVAGSQKGVAHPRTLVVAGANSRFTILESYGGLCVGGYFSNSVTEISLGPGAMVQHYRVQRQTDDAYHLGTTEVSLGAGASYKSLTVDMGARLARNNLNVSVAGEGASCVLNGLYLVTGRQHVDNQVVIDHVSPATTSRELYKGILGGRSRAVFHGSIIVRKGAQKVDAKQEDRNLLLSDQAEADTRPAFWIYADDVKCAHGAASGKLDEEALFYLKSRGIDEQGARSLLTKGFVHDVLATIAHDSIRAHTEATVATWLDKV